LAVASGKTVFRAEAHAKVNLCLHVIGRRGDGYHLLDSLVAFAAVHDLVEVLPDGGLVLDLSGPFARALDGAADNIVLRAARALAAAAGLSPAARIRLTKSLPVAAGLGGGSADAAATIRALAALWRVELDEENLARIGLALGADIPVCLYGRTAFMSGVGETIGPGPRLPPVGVVLVNPRVPVATAAVFAARTGPFSAPLSRGHDFADADELFAALEPLRNDLTLAAIRIAPVVGEVLGVLGADPDCRIARLSGSGASCFGLYRDAAAAAAAARRIAARHPAWWVQPTSFV